MEAVRKFDVALNSLAADYSTRKNNTTKLKLLHFYILYLRLGTEPLKVYLSESRSIPKVNLPGLGLCYICCYEIVAASADPVFSMEERH